MQFFFSQQGQYIKDLPLSLLKARSALVPRVQKRGLLNSCPHLKYLHLKGTKVYASLCCGCSCMCFCSCKHRSKSVYWCVYYSLLYSIVFRSSGAPKQGGGAPVRWRRSAAGLETSPVEWSSHLLCAVLHRRWAHRDDTADLTQPTCVFTFRI